LEDLLMRRSTSGLWLWTLTLALAPVFTAVAQQPVEQPAAVEPPAGSGEQTGPFMPPKPPTIWVIPDIPDFGYRYPGEHAAYTMTIQNSGNETLTIERIRGDCQCTSVEIIGDNRVLEPAGTMDVIINLEVPKETGPHSRLVEVYVVGNKLPAQIPMRVAVGYPIRVNGDPNAAVIADPIGVIQLDSVQERAFKVTAVNGLPPLFNGFDPAKDQPRSQYEVVYDWSMIPPSDYPRNIIIETDHPGAEFFEVPAMVPGHRRIRDIERWSTKETLVMLGRVAGDRPIKGFVTFVGQPLIPGAKLLVKGSNPEAKVRILGVRKPERGGGVIADFEITPLPGLRGFFQNELTFEMNEFITGVDVYARILEPLDPSLIK
jgi:hypothetical protein